MQENLRDMVLNGVEETGRELGRGSYGVVIELKVSGLLCAGKRLHEEFLAFASPRERRQIEERFVEECVRMGCLRHPNIVQFLGVCFERASSPFHFPTLIMEFLPMTLAHCLDRYQNIPDYMKYSVLKNVGIGLLYLHQQNPSIIHRDLSANNVLLTSAMQAKISDLGMAKIVNLNPAQVSARMTMCPGTPSYMPPEALSDHPTYDTSLDCFSFGCLIVHTALQKWPLPLPLLQTDPSIPGLLRPLTEVERRVEFIGEMDSYPGLRQLAELCLHNDPRMRPTAVMIVQELERLAVAHPPPCTSSIEMAQAKKTSLLEPNSRIQWSRLPDLPQGIMSGHAVILNGKIYYGRGFISVLEPDPHIHTFDLAGNAEHWETLPLPPSRLVALAAFMGHLVLAGGLNIPGDTFSNRVLSWDDSSSSWNLTLPPMPTARHKLTSVGYNQYLIVVGGWNGYKAVGIVEIFDADSQAWITASPLLTPALLCKVACYAGHLYVIGGDIYEHHRSVQHATISALIAGASNRQPDEPRAVWTTLPRLPVKSPPLAIWGSTLVALGGTVKDWSCAPSESKTVSLSSKILAYCPHTDTWLHVGDIPVSGSSHAVVALPRDELVVVGGAFNRSEYISKFHKATLTTH